MFQSLATKWHPNKAEMNRLCALVEDKCLNHFKNIVKRSRKGSKLYDALVTPGSSAGVKYRHRVAWVSFFSCDDVGPTVGDWGRISPICGAKIYGVRGLQGNPGGLSGAYGVYDVGTYMYMKS